MNEYRIPRSLLSSIMLMLALPQYVLGDAQGEMQGTLTVRQSEYARWRDSLPDDYPRVADYRRVMLRWLAGAEEFWGPDPERPSLGLCRFGERRHTHVRTARALPVYAALAADPKLDDPTWTRRRPLPGSSASKPVARSGQAWLRQFALRGSGFGG